MNNRGAHLETSTVSSGQGMTPIVCDHLDSVSHSLLGLRKLSPPVFAGRRNAFLGLAGAVLCLSDCWVAQTVWICGPKSPRLCVISSWEMSWSQKRGCGLYHRNLHLCSCIHRLLDINHANVHPQAIQLSIGHATPPEVSHTTILNPHLIQPCHSSVPISPHWCHQTPSP